MAPIPGLAVRPTVAVSTRERRGPDIQRPRQGTAKAIIWRRVGRGGGGEAPPRISRILSLSLIFSSLFSLVFSSDDNDNVDVDVDVDVSVDVNFDRDDGTTGGRFKCLEV